MEQTGKILIAIGVAIILIGLLLLFFGNKFSWFGNLPGDIRIERDNFKFYAPLASMLLISVALTFILWLVRKFFTH